MTHLPAHWALQRLLASLLGLPSGFAGCSLLNGQGWNDITPTCIALGASWHSALNGILCAPNAECHYTCPGDVNGHFQCEYLLKGACKFFCKIIKYKVNRDFTTTLRKQYAIRNDPKHENTHIYWEQEEKCNAGHKLIEFCPILAKTNKIHSIVGQVYLTWQKGGRR